MLKKFKLDSNTVFFHKTAEFYGGLSNMAPGFPITVGDVTYKTSEALYQCCKFPAHKHIRKKIVEKASPIAAKMAANSFKEILPNWDEIRIPVMMWCLEMKLHHNMDKFGRVINYTGDKTIIEYSKKDNFWGAVSSSAGVLEGNNVLGQLLEILRQNYRDGKLIPPDPYLYIPDHTLE